MAPATSKQEVQRREPGVQGPHRPTSNAAPETPTTAAGAMASPASAAAAMETQGTPGPRSPLTVQDGAVEGPMTSYGTMRRPLNSVMRAVEASKENLPLPMLRKFQAYERKVSKLLAEGERRTKEAERLKQATEEEKRKRDPPTGEL